MESLFLNIALRQQQELKYLLQQISVPRDKGRELSTALSSPLIKVITGPRRAGKSTLALQTLAPYRFAYFNFEDEQLPAEFDPALIIEALDQVYGSVEYLFFDEIQNLSRWEQLLNRLHRGGKNLIVTGSNAKLLGDELATALTGRHVAIELLPLSLREAHQFRPDRTNLDSTRIDPARMDLGRIDLGKLGASGSEQTRLEGDDLKASDIAENYLVKGGFPEVVLGRVEFRSYLSALWDSVILKDIVKRRRVRNIAELRDLLGLALSTMGSRQNNERIAQSLGGSLSPPTARRFLGYGAEAYLLVELQRYHRKPRQRLKADRKCYSVDNGYFSAKQVGVFQEYSKLLENLVFVELWRRGHQPNLDLFYYETGSGREVDFLVRQGSRNIELIQVSYEMGSNKTRDREYRSLLEASKELGVSELTIVTANEKREEQIDNLRVRIWPFVEWCLTG